MIRFQRGRKGDKVFVWDEDRLTDAGRWECRLRGCNKPAQHPFRKYCSADHRQDFLAWLYEQAPPDWGTLRSEVLRRDGYACVLCGNSPAKAQAAHQAKGLNIYGGSLADRQALRDAELEVDHINPVALYPDQEFDLSNLRTLCRRCHVRHGAKPQSRIWRRRNGYGPEKPLEGWP